MSKLIFSFKNMNNNLIEIVINLTSNTLKNILVIAEQENEDFITVVNNLIGDGVKSYEKRNQG